jgi:hypothetical protein
MKTPLEKDLKGFKAFRRNETWGLGTSGVVGGVWGFGVMGWGIRLEDPRNFLGVFRGIQNFVQNLFTP